MAAARKSKPQASEPAASPAPTSPARPPRYLPDVPLELIAVKGNVRRRFDEAKLDELAADIRQNGVLQPLVVRPGPKGGYVLVAGERRLRAAKMAELTAVPCACHDDMTDETAARVQLLENLHRADLDPIEEAEGLQALIEAHWYTQRGLAEALGCAQPTIANKMRILRLPETVRESISQGILAPATALSLLKFEDAPAIVEEAAKQLVEQKSTQAEAPLVIAGVVLEHCPEVDAVYYGDGATKHPDAHKDCPCRRVIDGRWGGRKTAVCISPERFEQVEAQAQRAKEQERESAMAAGGTLDVTSRPEWSYPSSTGEYVRLGRRNESGDHGVCPCRREAVDGGRPCTVCIDPKAWEKVERKAKTVANRAARAKLREECGRILHWSGEAASSTNGLPMQHVPGSQDLAWLLALLVEHIRSDYGPDGKRRVERDAFLRDVAGLSAGDCNIDHTALAAALAKRPAPDLWRAIIAWPSLCEGEGRLKSPAAWYRRVSQGLAPQDRCAVCDRVRDIADLEKTYLWRLSEPLAGISRGTWILVCTNWDDPERRFECSSMAEHAGFSPAFPEEGDGGQMAAWASDLLIRRAKSGQGPDDKEGRS